jgi:hypothetical protein
MSTELLTDIDEIDYPESDGLPMSDNTTQWKWMVKLVEELRCLFIGQMVFVAGNLFWYPVRGNNKIVLAPDAMVVFGRPPDDSPETERGSYLQWLEDDIAPQVVFEVLSPNNTDAEMAAKLSWYERYGVQEYYVIDPRGETVQGWLRKRSRVKPIPETDGFKSPLLGVRFVTTNGLKVFLPDGREFQSRDQAELRALKDKIRADQAESALEKAKADAEKERLNNEMFSAFLRQQGFNPEDVLKPKT